MKLKTVICPLCFNTISVSPEASVQHFTCPKKKPRGMGPMYVDYETWRSSRESS